LNDLDVEKVSNVSAAPFTRISSSASAKLVLKSHCMRLKHLGSVD
jgi:hypothetical protein